MRIAGNNTRSIVRGGVWKQVVGRWREIGCELLTDTTTVEPIISWLCGPAQVSDPLSASHLSENGNSNKTLLVWNLRVPSANVKTGPHTWREGRNWSKRLNTTDWYVADLVSKKMYMWGLFSVTTRWDLCYLHNRILKVYTEVFRGSVTYTTQRISTTPSSFKATSLNGLLRGTVRTSSFQGQGSGWGASHCLGPAQGSTCSTSSQWPPPARLPHKIVEEIKGFYF